MHPFARTHYSDAHEKVSLRLLPKSHQKTSQLTCAVYSFFTMFLFVSFIILCISKLRTYLSLYSNSPFPLSRKSAVICRRRGRNYRNNTYIAEKHMVFSQGQFEEQFERLKSYAGQYLFIVSCSNRGNRIRF